MCFEHVVEETLSCAKVLAVIVAGISNSLQSNAMRKKRPQLDDWRLYRDNGVVEGQ